MSVELWSSGLGVLFQTLRPMPLSSEEVTGTGHLESQHLDSNCLRPSQLLILDEPTSALDAEAEYEVFEQFRQLIKGKTAILISHRLSTVKMVDRIFVLEQGRIVETGSHQELLQLGETYARLFKIQAKYYQ